MKFVLMAIFISNLFASDYIVEFKFHSDKNWKDFSPISLKSFSNAAYLVLKSNNALLPKKSQRILFYMIEQDWLSNYAHLSGIEKSLQGLAYRATFESKMEQAATELERDYEFYKDNFLAFFPELVKHVQPWLVDTD